LIPDDVIQKVRERANVTEIVGEIVTLKRAGASLKGLCPFHGEKTPSFVVNPQQGTYHCYGCQAHGDSLTFLKETQNLNFPEAVKALALRVGVDVPEDRPIRPEVRKERAQKKALKDRLFDVQEQLTQWYELTLQRSSVAKGYLKEREITPNATTTFRLGWASDDVGYFLRWMNDHKILLEDLVTLGVVIPYDTDQPDRRGDPRLNGGRLRFRNRIMCPIFDIRDRVVGYSGRVINPQQKIAKYLNSPETPIFVKGDHLFGVKTARVAMRSNQVTDLILCEGNLDVISLWQAGFPNTVAAMGTALSERQATLITRLTNAVICVMDGDSAGQKAAFKSLPVLLSQGLNVRGKPLPSEQDPDSFIRTYGAVSFKDWLKDAPPLLLVKLNTLLNEYPRDPIGQAAIVKELIPLVRLISDEHQRPLFLDVMAKSIGVERAYLSQLLVQTYSDQSDGQNDHEVRQEYFGQAANQDSSISNGSLDEQQRYSVPNRAKKYRNTKSNQRFDKNHERPWWANVALQRGTGKTRPRVFGDHPTGEVDIKLKPAPQPPASLTASKDDLSLKASLFGYEREAVSTLFYSPALLDLFLERGGASYFSRTGIQEFLLSLKSERDEGKFSTGEAFFNLEQDRSLVAALKDCIAHPPIQNDKIDSERALNDLIKRLKRGQLQLQLQTIVQELKQLSLTTVSQNTDAEAVTGQRRATLLESYQTTQSLLQELIPSPKSS
jgi:DNA primase